MNRKSFATSNALWDVELNDTPTWLKPQNRKSIKQKIRDMLVNPILSHRLFDILEYSSRTRRRLLSTLVILVSSANSYGNSSTRSLLTLQLHRSSVWQNVHLSLLQAAGDSISACVACRLACDMAALNQMLLCNNLVNPIIRSLCNLVRKSSSVLPAACQTLIAFVRSVRVTPHRGLEAVLIIVAHEARYARYLYPWATVGFSSAFRSSDIKMPSRSASFLESLLTAPANFAQAIGVRMTAERVIAHPMPGEDQQAECSEDRVSGLVSLFWMLLHSDETISDIAAGGIKEIFGTFFHMGWGSLAANLFEEGCVPITWLAIHVAQSKPTSPISKDAIEFLSHLQVWVVEKKYARTYPKSFGVAKRALRNMNVAILLIALSASCEVPREALRQLWETLPGDIVLLRIVALLVTIPPHSYLSSLNQAGKLRYQTAIIRSECGDFKISLPRVESAFSGLSPLFHLGHLEHGKIPVLRGEYATWDYLFSIIARGTPSNTIDTTGSQSLHMYN